MSVRSVLCFALIAGALADYDLLPNVEFDSGPPTPPHPHPHPPPHRLPHPRLHPADDAELPTVEDIHQDADSLGLIPEKAEEFGKALNWTHPDDYEKHANEHDSEHLDRHLEEVVEHLDRLEGLNEGEQMKIIGTIKKHAKSILNHPKVKGILENPRVKAILNNPRIKTLPKTLRAVPASVASKLPIQKLSRFFKCQHGKKLSWGCKNLYCKVTCDQYYSLAKAATNKVNPMCRLCVPGCYCLGDTYWDNDDKECNSGNKCKLRYVPGMSYIPGIGKKAPQPQQKQGGGGWFGGGAKPAPPPPAKKGWFGGAAPEPEPEPPAKKGWFGGGGAEKPAPAPPKPKGWFGS